MVISNKNFIKMIKEQVLYLQIFYLKHGVVFHYKATWNVNVVLVSAFCEKYRPW
jgi:hypothetical protein